MLIDTIKKMEKLHKLIESEFRGTETDYARRLGISRRTLHNWLDEFHRAGAKIIYSRKEHKFLYLNNIVFKIEILTQEIEEILGGETFFPFRATFCTEDDLFLQHEIEKSFSRERKSLFLHGIFYFSVM